MLLWFHFLIYIEYSAFKTKIIVMKLYQILIDRNPLNDLYFGNQGFLSNICFCANFSVGCHSKTTIHEWYDHEYIRWIKMCIILISSWVWIWNREKLSSIDATNFIGTLVRHLTLTLSGPSYIKIMNDLNMNSIEIS